MRRRWFGIVRRRSPGGGSDSIPAPDPNADPKPESAERRAAQAEVRHAQAEARLGDVQARLARLEARLADPGAPGAGARPAAGPAAREEAIEAPVVLSLSRAELRELRALGMSIPQAKRVIQYRDERGGFRRVEELGALPGFEPELLDRLRGRLVP